LVTAAAVSVFAMTGAPSALADPVAVCTSDVVDGVEVYYCVPNPNANIITEVPDINVEFEPSFTIGFGS